MVEYLKTKKGYFYKLKKNGEKKRISYEEYNKKNKKIKNMIGGGEIKEIKENDNETEFEQKYAIINYGTGKISTYNLVNCIAIGGVFNLSGEYGTFLTHESPTDYLEHQTILNEIKKILDKKGAIITKIVIFRIDEPSSSVYKNGLTTTIIIDLMYKFCENLFLLIPAIINYSCDILTMRCGKAMISPVEYNTSLTEFRKTISSENRKLSVEPTETFIVEVLYKNNNQKIYKCPICKTITGTAAPKKPTNTSLFVHNYYCPNKNKIPVEN